VAEYMREVLYHPLGGFYAARGDTAIGSGGHFITSPEISVLFGEVFPPPSFSALLSAPRGHQNPETCSTWFTCLTHRRGSDCSFREVNVY
jgi:hypothetical protein